MNRFPLGMNNRQADHSLPEGTVRNVVNGNVDNAGKVRRRDGYERKIAGVDTHSGWSCDDSAFFVDSGSLMLVNDDLTTTTLVSGISGSMAYLYQNGTVYMCDSVRNWKYVDGALSVWAKPVVQSGYETWQGVQSHVDIYGLENTIGPVPGHILRFYAGRIWIAAPDGIAWYTEPFDFNHIKANEGYVAIAGEITLMEPVTGGIFFANDKKTWFHAGTPEDGFQIIERLNYGAIPGTSYPGEDGVIHWQSQRGAVIGTPDGQIQNVQEKNVATDTAVSGAGIVVEREGSRQFIAMLKQPTASPLAATSWIDAEVIRRGI